MSKSLAFKAVISNDRAYEANWVMRDLVDKESSMTSQEKVELAKLRRYTQKMFNAKHRFERRVCKKKGLPAAPVLMRSSFKRLRQFKLIYRNQGSTAAVDFMLAQSKL